MIYITLGCASYPNQKKSLMEFLCGFLTLQINNKKKSLNLYSIKIQMFQISNSIKKLFCVRYDL